MALALLLQGTVMPAQFIERSSLFERVTDTSGVVSFRLRVAPGEHQQALYYTQDMISGDGRYLWYARVVEVGGSARKTLAVIDLSQDVRGTFPQAWFEGESPWVHPETGDVYYVANRRSPGAAREYAVYRLSPALDAEPERIGAIPNFEGSRDPRQVVTHLTASRSREALAFDSGDYPVSGLTYFGVFRLASGQVEPWATVPRRMNHAQLNPVREDQMLLAEDYYDAPGGRRVGINNRIWLAHADGRLEPVFTAKEGNRLTHEWWDPSGQAIWYIDRSGATTGGTPGTARIDLADRRVRLVWPHAVDHSHASADGRFLVGDHGYKRWSKQRPVKVSFFNVETGREIIIASALPPPARDFHTHPHPQFDYHDRYVIYTTVVAGVATIAVTKVEDLVNVSSAVFDSVTESR